MVGIKELCHQRTSMFAKYDNNYLVTQGKSEQQHKIIF